MVVTSGAFGVVPRSVVAGVVVVPKGVIALVVAVLVNVVCVAVVVEEPPHATAESKRPVRTIDTRNLDMVEPPLCTDKYSNNILNVVETEKLVD